MTHQMMLRRVVKDICRGCSLAQEFSICSFEEHEMQEKCPCIECLVKTMCIESCSERNKIRVENNLII